MPDRAAILAAVTGALRLARFDADGMRWFDVSADGFWRSFFAAVLVAPGFAVLLALDLAEASAEPWAVVVVYGLAYVVGWATFPLLTIPLARLLGFGPRYVPLIVAYNWASVVQVLVMVPAVVLDSTGVLGDVGALVTMAAVAYLLVFEWFVIRTASGTHPVTAAGLVLLDLIASEFINSAAGALVQ